MTSEEFKLIRNALGWTQPKLAAFLGVSTNTIARYELKSDYSRTQIHPTVALVMGWIRDRARLPNLPHLSNPELFASETDAYQTDLEDCICKTGD